MRYALALAYQGTHFKGWQTQNNLPTIQETIEKALSYVADEPIQVTAAGRTDAGVHAAKQVIHFDTSCERPLHAWVFGCNSQLPSDISVQWVQPISQDFHARFSATARRYRYYIHNRRERPALLREQLTWHCRPLDVPSMQKAALYLLGEHDFSAFRAADCQSHSTNRTVEFIQLTASDDIICLDIQANAFLHHMVRNIVGTLFVIGEKKQPPEWMKAVLENADRKKAGITAPPEGLYMVDVVYPESFELPKTPLFNLL